MDARAYYLQLYEATHFQGKAAWTLDEAMVAHYRTVLPGHNSAAWLLWHVARGEDWAVQTLLQGEEQLLTRDGWGTRMGVAEPSFGGGMAREAMVALSERIDLDALRGYHAAVAAATRACMRAFDFATLNAPFDVAARLALAPEAQGGRARSCAGCSRGGPRRGCGWRSSRWSTSPSTSPTPTTSSTCWCPTGRSTDAPPITGREAAGVCETPRGLLRLRAAAR